MPLTEEQKKKYVAQGGVNCPYCGSSDLSPTGRIKSDVGARAAQNCRCDYCGNRWADIYELTDIEEVT